MAWVSALFVLFVAVGCALAGEKPRVFVLTDIANEPDDAMSLTRFLLYSNQFSVQGICATTSYWLQNQTRIDQIQSHIASYAQVLPNLQKHKPDSEGPWPSAKSLMGKTYQGVPFYGLDGVGEGKSSNGSTALRESVEASEEPTWVLLWGGGNVLAHAVWEYEQNHTQKEIEHFVSKLRVYSISDQDDSNPWLRRRHPQIFWIVSLHAMNIYNQATWTGISGEELYQFDLGGPDSSLVTNEWLQTNVRDVSSFGGTYPDFEFIMEGDTPSFLYLIQNGLGVAEKPYWGSWGGRYGRITDQDNLYVNTNDVDVPGVNNALFNSAQATIWRWRTAFQWDFSARMHWTSTPSFSLANHNPVVVINGSRIVSEPLHISVVPGQTVLLDASASYDPDVKSSKSAKTVVGKGFTTMRFWQYADASNWQRALEAAPVVNITPVMGGLSAEVVVPGRDAIMEQWVQGKGANFGDRTLHVICEVWDAGTPSLVGYKRVVLDVKI